MDRGKLEYLLNQGLSQREICKKVGLGQSTVVYWVSKYGLKSKWKRVSKLDGKEIVCCECGRKFVYKKSKGHSSRTCNSCLQLKRRIDDQKKIDAYAGTSCIKCGYNKCKRALTFHHRDPKSKKFQISHKVGRIAWEKMREELDKCDLLCANCHAEKEEGLF